MANHVSHAALPYPVKGCRFTIQVPYLDADGDPLDPTTPDTERSIDGAAFADCTEEVTTITGGRGVGYITLTGDEMNASMVAVHAGIASGPKATVATLYPRVLPVFPFGATGTAQAGAAGSITLDAGSGIGIDDAYVGCIICTTGGTGGGGGSGSLNNQARIITDYVGSTLVASVSPNWETTPDATTTYEILLTENALLRYANLLLWQLEAPLGLISGMVQANTNQISSGAIGAAQIAANAIGASELAADAVTEIQSGLATAAALATVQADTDDIQARLPAALVGGRIDASVGAVAAAAITAAAIATGAIDADALATDGIEEIADGVLGRTTAAHEAAYAETARSLYGLIAGMTHKREISGTNIVLYKSDDTTVLAEIPITTDAALNPIKTVDPP